jgi:CPA1 family monovalent cation:H+ antiporter
VDAPADDDAAPSPDEQGDDAAPSPEEQEEDALADGTGGASEEEAAERDRVERHARVRAVALAVVTAQRAALLDARDDGTLDAETLDTALATLDAAQISIELQGAPPEL